MAVKSSVIVIIVITVALFLFSRTFALAETNLNAGDNADSVVAGKGNTQSSNRQHNEPHQNVTVQGMAPETTLQGINWKLNEHGQQIFQLNFLMDDIPAKVQDLRTSQRETDGKQRETDGRLDRLEKQASTVITVKPGPPPEVEISRRMAAENREPEKIPVRTMLWILFGVGLFSLSMMGAVVWLVLHHG